MKKSYLFYLGIMLILAPNLYCNNFEQDLSKAVKLRNKGYSEINVNALMEAKELLLKLSKTYDPTLDVEMRIIFVNTVIANWSETITHFQSTIAKFENDVTLGYLYYSMGIAAYVMNQKDYKKYFEKAIVLLKSNDNDVGRFATIISCYAYLGKYSEGELYYQMYKFMYPNMNGLDVTLKQTPDEQCS